MLPQREYQERFVDAVFREWEKVDSTCVIAATGTGKTRMASEIILRSQPKLCMFICERHVLVHQAAADILRNVDLKCRIEQGGFRISPEDMWDGNLPIVASIQSLNSAWGEAKRMHKFKPKVVIFDEFHHCTSNQYINFFNYLKSLGGVKICGFSATPKRLDGKALGKHFETVAGQMEIGEAVSEGWLCEIAQEFVKVEDLDFSRIKTKMGDLDPKQLDELLKQEGPLHGMVAPGIEIAFGMPRNTLYQRSPEEWPRLIQETKRHDPFRTIMFCASVAHSIMAAEIFNRACPDLAHFIHGSDPYRDDKLKDFRAGKFSILCNCAVLGEGVDVPEVELILQGRPTKSLSLWIQQLGRGTRPLKGVVDGLNTPEERREAIAKSKKPFVRVVDFVGNSGRHKLISSIDALGGDYSEETKARTLADCVKRAAPVKMTAVLKNTEELLKEEKRKASEEAYRKARERQRQGILGSVKYRSTMVNPYEVGSGPSSLRTVPNSTITPLVSDRQRKVLSRAGIHPRHWTRKKANWIIGILADNAWQLPEKFEWLKYATEAVR